MFVKGSILHFLYVVCSATFDTLVVKLLLVRGEIYPSVSRPLEKELHIVRETTAYLEARSCQLTGGDSLLEEFYQNGKL